MPLPALLAAALLAAALLALPPSAGPVPDPYDDPAWTSTPHDQDCASPGLDTACEYVGWDYPLTCLPAPGDEPAVQVVYVRPEGMARSQILVARHGVDAVRRTCAQASPPRSATTAPRGSSPPVPTGRAAAGWTSSTAPYRSRCCAGTRSRPATTAWTPPA